MKYILIKKCRIIGFQEKNLDILIANEKIVSIGKNLSRPVIDCEEVDAGGRIAIPGLVDIINGFTSVAENEILSKAVYDDIRGGYTTWIGPVAPSNVAESLEQYSLQDPKTLNYGFHFNVNQFHHGDLSKIRVLGDSCGISTMLYSVTTPKAASNDRIDLYLATASKNNMLLIFDIKRDCGAMEHLDALATLCERINGTGSRVLFNNIRYVEEFDVIRKGRKDNAISISINLCSAPSPVVGLTSFGNKQFVSLLRQYPWVTGDVVGDGISRKSRVEALGAMCQEEHFSTEEIVEYMSVRKCMLIGQWPEKGRIAVGCDADICMLNELTNDIETVIMSGRVVYDNKDVKLNNVIGRQAFGRYV